VKQASQFGQMKRMNMKIKEILTSNPEVIHPDATLCEAARKMKQYDVGMLPVCDGEKLIGAITDRDMVIRAMANGQDPLSTPVREAMTPEIFYCFEGDDVEQAAQIMEKRQIRRLPVLNRDKNLTGIVSLGDLAIRTHDEHLVEEVLEHVCERT
jgi:CBS domain-containing protein